MLHSRSSCRCPSNVNPKPQHRIRESRPFLKKIKVRDDPWSMLKTHQAAGDHRLNLRLNAIPNSPRKCNQKPHSGTFTCLVAPAFQQSSIYSSIKWSIWRAGLTSTRECQCAMGFRGYDSISLQWSLPSLSASLPTWHTPMTSLWPTLWKWPTIVFS